MKQTRPRSKLVTQIDRMPRQLEVCWYETEHLLDGACWCQPVEIAEGVWHHFPEANN